MKVSACIIALNEEQYIERAILSLKKIELVEDIVVVDGGSTDNTVKICKQLGCNVVVNPWPNDFSIQRNLALSLCKNDWIIIADADEWYCEDTRNYLNQYLVNIPENIGAIKINEISELGCKNINDTPLQANDLEKYYVGYSQLENKEIRNIKFQVDDRTIILTYSTRIVNKTRGQWVNRVHEIFELNPNYHSVSLPQEYIINHQKSIEKQYLSDSRYDALMHNECLYTANYDDIINKTSQKSVLLLDTIFYKLITEVSPCDIFIEAGAFNGQTSRLVHQILPNTKVYAFEANTYNYNEFKSLFDNTTINYLNIAISNQTGEITFKIHTKIGEFNIPKIKGNDSLLSRSDDNVIYENITVPAVTLNGYFNDKINTLDSVALWVDLEGAAHQALEGATDILPNVNVIKIEVENYEFWQNQKLDTDIRIFLSQHGFVPILRDYEYTNQYNILFCKYNIIESQKFQNLANTYNLIMNRSVGTISEINRIKSINELYKKILKREADSSGLHHYQSSRYSIDEIENILLQSDEYKTLNVTQ
jgi:FkbM family methyltransferase